MRNLAIIALITTLFCTLTGCGKDDYDISGQQTKFQTYLKSVFPNGGYEALNDSTLFRMVFDPVRLAGDTIRDRASTLTTLVEAEAVQAMDSTKLDGVGRTIISESGRLRITGNRLSTMGNLKVTGESVVEHGDSLRVWGVTIRDSAAYFVANRDSLTRITTRVRGVAGQLNTIAQALRRSGVALIGNRVVLNPGDSVWFHYSGYLFSSSNYENYMFTTNVRADAEAANAASSVDAGKWPVESMDFSLEAARIHGGGLIQGLDIGMEGLYEGDSLLLFLTSDLAYGGKILGVVPEGSPVVFKIKIEKVKNN